MTPMGDADLRVGRLAAGQHSLVTHSQSLAAGLTSDQIDHRVHRGILSVVHRGVYLLPGIRPTYEGEALAACLATGGVASHRCAARLFRLRGFEHERRIEIAVDGQRAPRLPGVAAHRIDGLESTTIGPVPVAMPAEVLLGLAAVAPGRAEGALNDALVKGLVTLPALVRFLRRRGARGRDGTAGLRTLVEEQIRAGAPSESWLEDRLVEFLRRRGYPPPVRQYWVKLPDGRVRLDTAWPDLRLDVEADGRLWHTSPSDRRRDARRDGRLTTICWSVERVTWLQMVEEPDAVDDRIGRYFPSLRAAA
jgi:hypothetical protein